MILFIWQTVQSTPSVTAYYLFYGINIRRSMNMLYLFEANDPDH
jgi:hypothetical protein